MDAERSHFRTTSNTGGATAPTELFICFSSRLSSSSMRLSKSILSPGQAARDGGTQASLSSSLSRRLRSNGSIKGSQTSPFLAVTGKKRGCSFENPEPSSPKVTCIGQVRVKTKKKVKQTRSLSRRNGEVSFRKMDQQQQRFSNAGAGCAPSESQSHRNQRWVHLPVSICEALRSFSTDFNCLFPCKASCLSKEKTEKENGSDGNDNGCGAVFARWLVSVNDGEGGRRREIELVVGGGEETERVTMRSSRRHVFEDIEVKDDRIEVKGKSVNGNGEQAARVSICIPPKNALLLMRCRSDPVKMAALTNRFSWDRPKHEEEKEEEEIEEEAEAEAYNFMGFTKPERAVSVEVEEEEKIPDDKVEAEKNEQQPLEAGIEEEELFVVAGGGEEEEIESNMSSFEALLVLDHQETTGEEDSEDCSSEDEEVEDASSTPHLLYPAPDSEEETNSNEQVQKLQEQIEDTNLNDPATAQTPPVAEDGEEEQQTADGNEEQMIIEQGGSPVLPECLLLMMCEPKLSMEVSKETWVCRTDFIRWLPERPRRPTKANKDTTTTTTCGHEPVKRRLSIDSKPKANAHVHAPPPVPEKNDAQAQQPHRSSCSLPAAVAAASMATVIEHKLVNAVGYEPFVLTRCKSEPMRTAAAKLMPDWKNAVRKMEPHRRATLGAAGVGF